MTQQHHIEEYPVGSLHTFSRMNESFYQVPREFECIVIIKISSPITTLYSRSAEHDVSVLTMNGKIAEITEMQLKRYYPIKKNITLMKIEKMNVPF